MYFTYFYVFYVLCYEKLRMYIWLQTLIYLRVNPFLSSGSISVKFSSLKSVILEDWISLINSEHFWSVEINYAARMYIFWITRIFHDFGHYTFESQRKRTNMGCPGYQYKHYLYTYQYWLSILYSTSKLYVEIQNSDKSNTEDKTKWSKNNRMIAGYFNFHIPVSFQAQTQGYT